MVNSKILIISDQYELARTWVPSLTQLRLQVRVAPSKQLPEHHNLGQHDLIIIDSYTPGYDFVAQCNAIRNHFQKVLLGLTYERDERFHLQLYEAGIDESIIKPLGIPLFLAKISVWLRRVEEVSPAAEQLRAAHFYLEPNRKRLIIDNGEPLRLSTLECNLLALLMSNQGRILETDLIVDRVWPNYGNGDKDLLKNLIYRLRRKIEPDPATPQYIQTVNGHGYSFRVD